MWIRCVSGLLQGIYRFRICLVLVVHGVNFYRVVKMAQLRYGVNQAKIETTFHGCCVPTE